MTEIDTAAIRRGWHPGTPEGTEVFALCDALDQARADVALEEWGERRRTSLRILYQLEMRAEAAEARLDEVRAWAEQAWPQEFRHHDAEDSSSSRLFAILDRPDGEQE